MPVSELKLKLFEIVRPLLTLPKIDTRLPSGEQMSRREQLL